MGGIGLRVFAEGRDLPFQGQCCPMERAPKAPPGPLPRSAASLSILFIEFPICRLFQRDFGVLDGERNAGLGAVEYVEDDGLGAAVLAVVNGVDHLHDRFAGVDDLFRAIEGDDGQFALLEDAVVHYGVVVPAEFLPRRDFVADGHEFGAAGGVVGQFCTVPALRGADEFRGADGGGGGIFRTGRAPSQTGDEGRGGEKAEEGGWVYAVPLVWGFFRPES